MAILRCTIGLIAVIGIESVSAQAVSSLKPKWADSSVNTLVANYRAGKLDLLSVLRQSKGTVARSTLDSVADSLVSIALEKSGPDGVTVQARSDAAINQLALSGQRATGRDGSIYPGATERLIRIATEAKSAGTRRVANGSLIGAGSIELASAHLLVDATSNNPTIAPFAMAALTRTLEPQTVNYANTTASEREILRQKLKALWESNVGRPGALSRAVPDTDALALLSRIARLEKMAR